MTLLATLQAKSTLLPGTIAWQTCLQEAYTSFKPSVTDFAQAIYTAWSSAPQAPQQRVNFVQLTGGLNRITNDGGNPVYATGDVTTAANALYMEITIFVDTVGLRAAAGATTGGVNAGSFISMSDNHPGDDGNSAGTCELNDQGLAGNMTIHWRAATSSGNAPADTVNLGAFRVTNGNWSSLASDPVNLNDGSWVAYANPVPTPNTTVAYAFDFTINDSGASFWFDPFIGDNDRRVATA
jgi:hypothetical protein